MLRKFLPAILIMAASATPYAAEVAPIFSMPNTNDYGPKEILMYKIKNHQQELNILSYPLRIENNSKTSAFSSKIDPECERVEKIYQQTNAVFVVTQTCPVWYGMKSTQTSYQIYQFNETFKVVGAEQIHIDEDVEVNISEIDSGVKLVSSESSHTGKTYHYEYQQRRLYDFSSAMKRDVLAKEKQRQCRGFYDQVYTQFVYQPHLVLADDLYNLLSSAQYSWVDDRITQSEQYSRQLAHELKSKSLIQRKNTSYESVKNKFC